MPVLPTEVQSIDIMAMRLPFAIQDVFSQAELNSSATTPAGACWPSGQPSLGLRLIISREDCGELGILVHVSGSVWRADRLPNLDRQWWAADQATWMLGPLNQIASVEPKFIKAEPDLVNTVVTRQGVVGLYFRDLEERRREPGDDVS